MRYSNKIDHFVTTLILGHPGIIKYKQEINNYYIYGYLLLTLWKVLSFLYTLDFLGRLNNSNFKNILINNLYALISLSNIYRLRLITSMRPDVNHQSAWGWSCPTRDLDGEKLSAAVLSIKNDAPINKLNLIACTIVAGTYKANAAAAAAASICRVDLL